MPSTLLKTIVLLSLASFAVADLHTNAICVSWSKSGANVYNSAATIASCNSYLHRNTGGKQWDKCPDCKMTQSSIGNPFCQSAGWHIGGDEFTYYCRQHGASNALTL